MVTAMSLPAPWARRLTSEMTASFTDAPPLHPSLISPARRLGDDLRARVGARTTTSDARRPRLHHLALHRFFRRFAVAAILSTVLVSVPCTAGSEPGELPARISIDLDMAAVLRLPDGTASVILGNPTIADVTVSGNGSAIITAKSVGLTNLIVQTAQGDLLGSTQIEVQRNQAERMLLYRGAVRESYRCQPRCEPDAAVVPRAGVQQ